MLMGRRQIQLPGEHKKSRREAGCTNQIPLTIKPYPMKTLNYIYNSKIQNLGDEFCHKIHLFIHRERDICKYYKQILTARRITTTNAYK
jgi:hypothetical protein